MSWAWVNLWETRDLWKLMFGEASQGLQVALGSAQYPEVQACLRGMSQRGLQICRALAGSAYYSLPVCVCFSNFIILFIPFPFLSRPSHISFHPSFFPPSSPSFLLREYIVHSSTLASRVPGEQAYTTMPSMVFFFLSFIYVKQFSFISFPLWEFLVLLSVVINDAILVHVPLTLARISFYLRELWNY